QELTFRRNRRRSARLFAEALEASMLPSLSRLGFAFGTVAMIKSNFDNQASGRRFRINEEITARSVRVVDRNNVNHGVMALAEAVRTARGLGLDLVEIAPGAHPAICKMIKWSEFRRELEAKK